VGISHPNALNEGGTAVGSSNSRAARWDASSPAAVTLGNIVTDDATPYGEAFDINDAGFVVGYQNKEHAGIGGSRGVRWNPTGAAQELGILSANPAGYSENAARAINNLGIAVGECTIYDSAGDAIGTHAVYWGLDGSAVDLNILIDPAAGWVLSQARAISDSGWIAGSGWFDPDGAGERTAYPRLFSMQIPEPTAAGTCGLLVLWVVNPRRRFQAPVASGRTCEST
jgi:hypothetical protein